MSDEELQALIAQAEGTPMQARLLELYKLPPEQREAEIAALTRAYGPMRDDLRSEIERNFATVMGSSPQGQVAGNNPFSVYVAASPLEHLASGMQKYQAGKDLRGQREELKGLSAQESEQARKMMSAQAAAIYRQIEEEKRRKGAAYGWGNF